MRNISLAAFALALLLASVEASPAVWLAALALALLLAGIAICEDY
jgi:hypothetical protein